MRLNFYEIEDLTATEVFVAACQKAKGLRCDECPQRGKGDCPEVEE